MELLSEVSSLLSEKHQSVSPPQPSTAPRGDNGFDPQSSRKSAQWPVASSPPPPQFLDVSEIRMNALPSSSLSPPPAISIAPQPPATLAPQLRRDLYTAPVPNPEYDAILQLIERASQNVHLCEIDVVARRVRQQEIDELQKAIELLEDERRYLKHRCAVVYENINEVNERHRRLVEVLTPKLGDEQLQSPLMELAGSVSVGSNPHRASGGAGGSKVPGSMVRTHSKLLGGPGGAASSSSAASPFPLPISSGPLSKATVDTHYAHFDEASRRLSQR